MPRTLAQLYRSRSPAESSTGGREAPLHTAERSNRRPQTSVNAVDNAAPPHLAEEKNPLKIPGSHRDPDQLQNVIFYFASHTPTPREKTNRNSSTTF